ncbi:MAG: hypothetical protein HW390_430 [Candidatus Brocadiaceae bacterium]|nr:hypothetical protein [Candidatus Brocadiaceae bacterium]
MPLLFDAPNNKRNKQDIDEIFSYIYYDLLSIHPSNEYFKIFLQYFQPLFDLSFGIVFLNSGATVISSYYLSSENEQILQTFYTKFNDKLERFNCSNWKSHGLQQFPYIADAKSCLIIPIVINGCSKLAGSFYLFSRLKSGGFNKGLLDYIYRQIKACVLQQSARVNFLLNNDNYRCTTNHSLCNGEGFSVLNKFGIQLCEIISLAKKT